MRLTGFVYIFTLGSIIHQCGTTQQKDLNQFMVDSWQTSFIKITMPTHMGSDTTSVYEDKFTKKNTFLAQSVYRNDGTFEAWYLSPKGERKNRTTGQWQASGDSLNLSYVFNKKDVRVHYQITETNEGFEGVSVSDWDNDGVKDDTLIMRTKRIDLTVEKK